MERSQWWPSERLRALQREKLTRLLRHAWRHVPYYRRCFAEAGLNSRDMDDPGVLARLPLLGKEDIRRNRLALRWPSVPGGLFEYNTGGSTGEPLIFEFDLGRQADDQAARMRSHRWFNADIGEREVYVWGSPVDLGRQDRLKILRDRLTNQLLLSAFEMTTERMDEYVERIRAYRPVSLFGYPSSLALLCEHAESRGRSLQMASLRVVFVTGERLLDQQREAIERVCRVPVADGYGSREGGFIAHQCPAGSMHITSESIVLEVVDDRGRGVPDGESGELVVTHLDTVGMPFIRYRTGDRGRRLDGVCACGRGLERMDVVEGRQTDFVIAADGGAVHALALIYVLREIPGVRQFQIVQQEDRDVDVLVASAGMLSDDVRARITVGIQARLGERIQVTVRQVDRIDPAQSGKHRYVISRASRFDA